jgi:hypothetical protein
VPWDMLRADLIVAEDSFVNLQFRYCVGQNTVESKDSRSTSRKQTMVCYKVDKVLRITPSN